MCRIKEIAVIKILFGGNSDLIKMNISFKFKFKKEFLVTKTTGRNLPSNCARYVARNSDIKRHVMQLQECSLRSRLWTVPSVVV
jgi:hypothetical protein